MIFFVRHSERVDLESKILFKEHKKRFHSTDPCLTPRGTDIAYQTGISLNQQITGSHPGKKIVVISSPYYRCIQTSVQIMKAISDEHLHSNTLLIEDAFSEGYNAVFNCLCKETPEKQVYKQVVKGDIDLRNEIFGKFDHAHNTLLDYSQPTPYYPVWEESRGDVHKRQEQGLQELSDQYSKPEFKNTLFVVIGHGSIGSIAKIVGKTKDFIVDYCSFFNFNIEKKKITIENSEISKEKNSESRKDYDWTLINGEQYGYDHPLKTNFDFFYVRHSIRCDKNDRPSHIKHVQRGLAHRDTPQTEYGKEIAFDTGKYLKEELFSGKFPGKKNFVVISSPYHRCLQTSKSLIDGFGRDLLMENNIFVEEGFEEFYNVKAHTTKDIRWQRSFNRFDYDEELKYELIEDINYTKNALLNYEFEEGPMKVKWMESVEYMISRFYYRFLDLDKMMKRNPQFKDSMVVVVGHGCIRDSMSYFKGKELDVTKYCAVNLLRINRDGTELLEYNKICYDHTKIVENDLLVALDEKEYCRGSPESDNSKIVKPTKNKNSNCRMMKYAGLGLAASFILYNIYRRNK